MKRLPKPIHFTNEEGGVWIKWADRRKYNNANTGVIAHCIVFDNGRAFDMLSGWRDGRRFKYDKKTGNLIT